MCKPTAPLIVLLTALTLHADDHWPDFRGPQGNGHSNAIGLPLTWSETQNVAWKTAIPGRGWSSPVVWGDQVWLTTATADGRVQSAVAVDAGTGALLHNIRVFEVDQPQEIDVTNSYASPSPVIEQNRVYVHFGTQPAESTLWPHSQTRRKQKWQTGMSAPRTCPLRQEGPTHG